jgi:membrane protein
MNTMWTVLKQTIAGWNEHEAPRMGAALAFYTILSLSPLVIVVIAIVATIVGSSSAQTQLLAQVEGMMGAQSAEAVKQVIEHGQQSSSGIIPSILGVVTLLFGASGVFGELRAALNKIWDVKPESVGGIWRALKQRFFSFGMVLAVGFMLLVSLMISAALAAFIEYFGGVLPLPGFVLHLVDLIISLGTISGLFALIFRYVPATTVPWRSIWKGATVTAVFITIGKFLIGLYLGKAAFGSAYGAAGSLVVFIVWVYYTAMIFMFGAEFTHVLASANTAQNTPRNGTKSQQVPTVPK